MPITSIRESGVRPPDGDRRATIVPWRHDDRHAVAVERTACRAARERVERIGARRMRRAPHARAQSDRARYGGRIDPLASSRRRRRSPASERRMTRTVASAEADDLASHARRPADGRRPHGIRKDPAKATTWLLSSAMALRRGQPGCCPLPHGRRPRSSPRRSSRGGRAIVDLSTVEPAPRGDCRFAERWTVRPAGRSRAPRSSAGSPDGERRGHHGDLARVIWPMAGSMRRTSGRTAAR